MLTNLTYIKYYIVKFIYSKIQRGDNMTPASITCKQATIVYSKKIILQYFTDIKINLIIIILITNLNINNSVL